MGDGQEMRRLVRPLPKCGEFQGEAFADQPLDIFDFGVDPLGRQVDKPNGSFSSVLRNAGLSS